MKRMFTVFTLLLFCVLANVKAQKVEVYIKGIRSAEGTVVIGVFKDNESFKEEKPYLRKKYNKDKLVNGALKVTFDIEPGKYGISLLDDEDNDDKMNFNFLGIPQEGFGFSNYYLTGLTRPKLESFEFEVFGEKTTRVMVKIKYM